MITISLCMIVRNEEQTLGRCLDSVFDLTDEIIIVDTGSKDRTREIAANYTDKIFDFEWIDDFAAARNFSFSLATQEYILWLDADDYLLEADREKFRRLKETLSPDVDAALMDYVLTRDPLGGAQNITRRHRLLRRDRHFRWVGPVHEYIPVTGKVLRTDIEITHAPNVATKDLGRNLRILRKMIGQNGGQTDLRSQFYLANELLTSGQTEEAEKQYLALLASEAENFEDHINACGALSHIYHEAGDKERELQYLMRTFRYARPRADYCCRIGLWFQENGRFDLAVFWHELALMLGEPDSVHGLINKASWTWMPHVQLAVCYGKLGMLEKAWEHNERALAYYPNDPVLLNNRKILENAMGHAAQTSSAPGPDGESANGEEKACSEGESA